MGSRLIIAWAVAESFSLSNQVSPQGCSFTGTPELFVAVTSLRYADGSVRVEAGVQRLSFTTTCRTPPRAIAVPAVRSMRLFSIVSPSTALALMADPPESVMTFPEMTAL